jgi:hypothetical protein
MFDMAVKNFYCQAWLEVLVGYSSSTEVVEVFWSEVWKARNPDKVDDFVVEDFVITSGGERVEGRENFKAWASIPRDDGRLPVRCDRRCCSP